MYIDCVHISHVLVIKTGFSLVILFINHLQLVTTNNYYTIPDLHNLYNSVTESHTPNTTAL
jgi:hypothetical protein